MAINTKTFTDLLRTQVAAIQGAAAGVVDFTVGSIERAIVESTAQVALWLQGLILALLATTRASTSSGASLDTWMADFSFTRLQAASAAGVATFARFTTTAQGIVPVGTLIEPQDGSQQFTVTADPTNGAYNAGLGGYVLAPSVASVNVPVLALTAGAAGNAVPGSITQIVSAIPGIDTVTNAAAFTGGADAEADTSFRARFVAYLASLARATKAAITYAVQSLQAGATLTLTENFAYSGSAQPGYFYAVVDDGSGSPSGAFLTAAANAIEAVRPFTVSYGVFAPTVVTANVSMTITAAATYSASAVSTAVTAALTAYINGLGDGVGLPWSRLAQVAYDASPGVANVASVIVNGGTSDLTATAQQTIKAGSVVVSHT